MHIGSHRFSLLTTLVVCFLAFTCTFQKKVQWRNVRMRIDDIACFLMLASFKTYIRHCPSLLVVRTTEKKLQWRNVRMRLDAHCAHWRALKRGTASLFNRPCPCQCYTPGLLDYLHVMMTMTMPMMTLAFMISIRWKYMFQDVERVLTNSDTYLQ